MGSLETEAVAVNSLTLAPKTVAHSEPNSQTLVLKPPHAFCLVAQNH
jgi:hypothetical protein